MNYLNKQLELFRAVVLLLMRLGHVSTCQLRRAYSIRSLALLMPALFILSDVAAQSTTINTHLLGATGYGGGTSTGTGGTKFITFVVANNSGVPMKLTDVGTWTATSHNGSTSTLYYSSTSLSGTVGTLPTTGWNVVDVNTVSGITATTVNPVNVNMNFIIPDGAVYRFAILTTGTNYYSSSSTPNNFTAAGVTLYTGNHQIGGSNVGYAATLSPRYFTGFITFEPLGYGSNNASVVDLTSPKPSFCAGNYPVKVQIRNSGTNTINSVGIGWELDGIPQPPVSYNMAMASGASAEITLSNSEAFGSNLRTIKAWTTMPNGVVDTVTNDDTLKTGTRAGLSGTYTVGTGGDFLNVVDAADALTKFGVCGPVVMNILPGIYTGSVVLSDVSGTSATNTVTFKSQNGNSSSVIINAAAAGTGAVVLLANTSYVTIRDVTMAAAIPNEGRVVTFTGSSSYDNILHCVINSQGNTTSSNSAGIYAEDITGGNLTIVGNVINRGYYGIRVEGVGTTSKSSGNVIDSNELNEVYYGTYCYYTDDLKIRNNKIVNLGATTTFYGIYTQYCDGALHILNNEIAGVGAATSTMYGMYCYYNDGAAGNGGIILNNSIAIDNGSSTAQGIYSYYSSYQNFVNNSVSVTTTATGSWAGRFYYSSSSYSNNKIYNNAFYYSGGADYTMYIYRVDYNNEWDYNNIYSATGKLVEVNTPAGTFNTLEAWQQATGQDVHSISYNPGFTSNINLRPDRNNPASWSLNGRALQIAGNTLDLDNNARVDIRQNGVPDIGAFEFTPEVEPPVATATPANSDQGVTQVFTFGEREVARVKWGTRAPVGQLEVRQYSGRKGAGIVSDASPSGTMYFYTDVKSLGSSDAYDIELNIDYMDIWLGDISNEADLRMAHKVPNYSWRVYNGALSTSDAISDNIDAESVHRFGSFTGLENESIPSAFVRPNGKVVFCIGDVVQLNAEPLGGTYYKWYLSGSPIPGAEGPNYSSYMAMQAGSYSVAVTSNGKVVESVPLPISTIAAPNAVIAANSTLTYCPGNGLTLNAGTVTGVAYQWQLNGNDIPGATSNTYGVQQPGDYTLVATNIACSTVSSITPVTAGPLEINLGNDTTYCEERNVWAKLDAGYPGAKYRWSTGDTGRTIELRRSGDVWVEVDAGPNCVDRDTINVMIDPLPSASGISFLQNGNTYTFYPGGPQNVTGGYLWIFSDGSQSNQYSPTKTITGDLYVRLVMFNACGTDTTQLGWPLSVSKVVDEGAVNLYPNPAKDMVTITVDGLVLNTVEIINSVGAVVDRAEVSGVSAYSADVSSYANGYYMMRATTNGGIITRQFSVVK